MPQSQVPIDTAGSILFPQFKFDLLEMTSNEIKGLSRSNMDFTSDQWEWGKWSIKRNLQHVAAGNFRWFLDIWGEQLFPHGYYALEHDVDLGTSPYSWRRLDGDEYWSTDDIMEMFRMGLNLAQYVLESETVGGLRTRRITRENTDWWKQIAPAHPSGIIPVPDDPSQIAITMEATFRHRYFEHITHLYNIQRLKRAQGVPIVSEIPVEGYHALPDWDTSEPS